MSPHPYAELICAYLDGLPGATDVLNDALEESGRPRLMVSGDAGERLAQVLEELLVEPLAKRVAVDFARHVAGHCDPSVAQMVLETKQAQLELSDAKPKPQHQLQDSFEPREQLFQLGWNEANSPRSSAAWSLWGALIIPVRYVAQAAQRANTTELQWQITHLKQLLGKA